MVEKTKKVSEYKKKPFCQVTNHVLSIHRYWIEHLRFIICLFVCLLCTLIRLILYIVAISCSSNKMYSKLSEFKVLIHAPFPVSKFWILTVYYLFLFYLDCHICIYRVAYNVEKRNGKCYLWKQANAITPLHSPWNSSTQCSMYIIIIITIIAIWFFRYLVPLSSLSCPQFAIYIHAHKLNILECSV